MTTAKRRLSIASDHAGYELKEFLKREIQEVEWIDEGPYSTDRTDYPDYALKVARKVADHEVEHGVLVCGSGIGMCIAANKIPGIRGAVVESERTARLSREHNDANVLCLGARILTPETAKSIVNVWLNTAFEGGRHTDRIRKITTLEQEANGSSRKPE